ncbi:9899_t:CDS:2, partial [Scutellospora calospora]
MNKSFTLKQKKEKELLKAAKPVVAIFSAISSLQKEIAAKTKKIKNKKTMPEEIEKLQTELKKKEKELEKMGAKKIAAGKKAIRFLLHYNQNLVKYIVKGYSSFGGKIDHDELTSEGISSLPKAIEKFDLNSKNRFATYAEKKSVIYYDSNYQNEDKESKSYSLVETLHDEENAELTADQVKPTNLLDIYYLATEEEKKELKKKMKLSEKSNPELLQKYSPEEKKIRSLPLVANYLSLFSKNYKLSEIATDRSGIITSIGITYKTEYGTRFEGLNTEKIKKNGEWANKSGLDFDEIICTTKLQTVSNVEYKRPPSPPWRIKCLYENLSKPGSEGKSLFGCMRCSQSREYFFNGVCDNCFFEIQKEKNMCKKCAEKQDVSVQRKKAFVSVGLPTENNYVHCNKKAIIEDLTSEEKSKKIASAWDLDK